jgi:DNA-binding transcriptional ArsR family regulator
VVREGRAGTARKAGHQEGELALPRSCPVPVNALAREFAQSRPAISRHLRVLRETHVVTEQRVGRERICQLHATRLQDVAGWIEGYRASWQRKLDSLERHLEENP